MLSEVEFFGRCVFEEGAAKLFYSGIRTISTRNYQIADLESVSSVGLIVNVQTM